ncbi:MAG: hypothetical protein MHMPM18_004168, partial [Marteilia pararefringens]
TLEDSTTHYVTDKSLESSEASPIISKGIWILPIQYLDECIEKHQIIAEKDFIARIKLNLKIAESFILYNFLKCNAADDQIFYPLDALHDLFIDLRCHSQLLSRSFKLPENLRVFDAENDKFDDFLSETNIFLT